MSEHAHASVHEAMAAALADVGAVGKTSSKEVRYQFRSVDAVVDAVHEAFARHGLFASPRVLDDWRVEQIPGTPDGKGNPRTQTQAVFRLEIVVRHESGTEIVLGPGMCQSHDYGDKAVYQAQQNGYKYVLVESLLIPTNEPDMDSRHPDDVPAAPTPAEIAQRATNQLKADVLAAFAGDKAAAGAFYAAELAARGMAADAVVADEEMRSEIRVAAIEAVASAIARDVGKVDVPENERPFA